ncbi:MAG: 16S rRNA (guanine(527)-N(7))-methyltransferase RsmG [Deltaproteobacteria bacterium]|nr:16S rRNA (guanine(527)-N(7))-methyltransferase RsmG [Deltaproteobacteria bacterium]
MRPTNFREILEQGCATLNLRVSGEGLDRLARYCTELGKWNRKMNLIAQASEQEIIESHFLDSLTLLPHLPGGEKSELLDVGSGAGFPGLVVKSVLPELRLTLIEPRAKRAAFLRHMVRTLGLGQVDIREERLEPSKGSQPATFPCITSRALTTIGEFLELTAPLSPTGGIVICMKGPKAEEEISRWRADPASPYTLQRLVPLTLPFSGATRNLVIFVKN